jgi:hypothetical protein
LRSVGNGKAPAGIASRDAHPTLREVIGAKL